MPESIWKIQQTRKQIAVIEGLEQPTIVLKNARYLHSVLKQWLTGNIWILDDRIVYVGNKMPKNSSATEIVDLNGKTVVPGYIEPHVHPFQLYNPLNFADFAAQFGTTTFISDNMSFILSLPNKTTFAFLDKLKKLPFSFYWWARFDAQTEMENHDEIFTNTAIFEWLQRDDVLLGGELTGWPRLLRGDDQMLYWIKTAKVKGKKIEGHLPGASEKTLVRMKLLGVDGDHEAMTVEEVEKRILHGYAVTLRHSSIRPDLPHLLKGILEKKLNIFDHLMMTTDGSTPSFYEDGIMDKCIQIAIDAGVDPIDAYNMASYNIARNYNMTQYHGFVATGRFASLNILKDEYNPNPESVLSKGVWLKRDNKKVQSLPSVSFDMFEPLKLSFDLTNEDFQFSMPIGLSMENDVITKPYSINLQTNNNEILPESDEDYLMLVDRNGKWRVNTFIKGFATNVAGLASSYSNTGDIILIGKSFEQMNIAFEQLKKMNGGIVLVEDGKVVESIPLTIGGSYFDGDVLELIEKEKALKQALKVRGYKHSDAIYSLLFLLSTHLPYIRMTPKGLYDVMKQEIMIPAVIR